MIMTLTAPKMNSELKLVHVPLTFKNTSTMEYVLHIIISYPELLLHNKCGHRNVLSKRQVWMSIFHIINLKKKKIHGDRDPGFF
jgi:hypothetical protein